MLTNASLIEAIEQEHDKQEMLAHLRKELLEKAPTNLLAQSVYCLHYYEPQWFHKVILNLLDDWIERKVKNIMLFMPPRFGKSEIVSKIVPSAVFGRYPDRSLIAASYSGKLATEMNEATAAIMDLPAYQEIFPNTRISPFGKTINGAKRNSEKFEIIDRRGKYFATAVGKGITGMGGDYIIVDDVIKDAQEADSITYRNGNENWYYSTLMNRGQNKDVSKLLTFTRWHEDDLAGRLLRDAAENPDADQWMVVTFPAVMDTEPHPLDIREAFSGEALWEEKFPISYMNKFKAKKRWWNAQWQQRPKALGGNMVSEKEIIIVDEAPSDATDWIMAWDLTFKGENERKNPDKGSYVVGQVWCRKGANFYMVKQYRGKPTYKASKGIIARMHLEFPQCTEINLEDAANGSATLSDLRDEIPGINVVKTKGQSKIERFHVVSAYFQSGNVHVVNGPWVNDYIDELTSFPKGVNDDQVDATTLALSQFKDSYSMVEIDLGHGLKKENWRY